MLCTNLDVEGAFKALPDLNFWVPDFMAEGPFLGLSDPNLWGLERKVEGPFGTYRI